MHLGFYIGQLGMGGAERQLSLIVQHLHQLGEQVTVITSDPDGLWYQSLCQVGVPVHYLMRHGSYDWQRVRQLRQFLDQMKIGTLFCWGTAEAFYGRLAVFNLATEVIVCLRNQSWNGITGLWADRLLSKTTLLYIANSHIGYHYLLNNVGIPHNKVQFVFNGVDRNGILRSGQQLMDPRPKNISGAWCGWVGSLTERKDPHLLAKTAIEACREEKSLHIVIVGDGPLYKYMKKVIDDSGMHTQIHLCGGLPGAAGVWRFMDFGLSTSRVEGTPNVLLEAMTWGRPYIAPPVGDYPYLIQHGKNGLLATERSSAQLANLVVQLARDTSLRHNLGLQAQITINSYPSPEEVACRYRDLAYQISQKT